MRSGYRLQYRLLCGWKSAQLVLFPLIQLTYSSSSKILHNMLSLLCWPRSAFYEDTHHLFEFHSGCDVYCSTRTYVSDISIITVHVLLSFIRSLEVWSHIWLSCCCWWCCCCCCCYRAISIWVYDWLGTVLYCTVLHCKLW